MTTEYGRAPVPAGIDTERPSAARVYDWYLDGKMNYRVDREFGQRAVEQFPAVKGLAVANRKWLGRIVRNAIDEGITQFIDLGAGVPTVGAVHEIVQEHTSGAGKVVYVDNEGVAAAHGRLILNNQGATDWAGVVQVDLRDPDGIMNDSVTTQLIDWNEPVCLLAVAVLHFVGPVDQPDELVRVYGARLPPGSWFACSHLANDAADGDGKLQVQRFVDSYQETQNPLWLRDRSEIMSWFDGYELLPPGVVPVTDWRPDEEAAKDIEQVRPYSWCGVGRKPSI
jgi:O-methyltransferase involved in polyketide biosynthesis